MSFFKDELKTVKALIFDVDGVLSEDVSPLDENGDPMRTANVKDGLAMRMAIHNGFEVGIITGGTQLRVKFRHEKLGVKYYYENVHDKVVCLEDFITKTGISAHQILYMGDDLADFQIMQKVGIPTCPADAVHEIKSISRYISDKCGGRGCVRDVIEQVMRAQEKWFSLTGNTNKIQAY